MTASWDLGNKERGPGWRCAHLLVTQVYLWGLTLRGKSGDEIQISLLLLPTLYPPNFHLASHIPRTALVPYCEQYQRDKGLDSGLKGLHLTEVYKAREPIG